MELTKIKADLVDIVVDGNGRATKIVDRIRLAQRIDFILALAGSEVSDIEGGSAAGSTPELRRQTPAIDADILLSHLTNEQKLLQYFKTRFFDNLLVKKFKLCEVSNELEFEPLNEKEFYKNMTENISYYEEKIDEYKEDLYNCSIEKVSNEEERKNQEEDINIYKKSIERYEQLILRDKHIRDKGSIEYLKSGECKKVQNEFHSMLKLLKTQDIWNINFRRDGEAPESDFEDYLAKLCFNQNIHITITGKDRYNRYLAYTFLNDTTELSSEMIKAGLAWHYKEYNADKEHSIIDNSQRNMRLRGIYPEPGGVNFWWPSK